MLLPSKMRLTEEAECSRFASDYDRWCAPSKGWVPQLRVKMGKWPVSP